jgi:C1A family cysteine protease
MTVQRRSCSFLAAVFVFTLLGIFSASVCLGHELDEIKGMIRAKGHKWTAGETSVSKLPTHERNRRCGLLRPAVVTSPQATYTVSSTTGATAANIDWRKVGGDVTQNFVTPVRDQGSCGSCWAFASAGALESYILIKDSKPGTDDNRAEEILLSCCTSCRPVGYGTCDGGYVQGAADYVRGTGLPSESYFGYTATSTDDVCTNAKTGWDTNTYKIGLWTPVTYSSVSIDAIKSALASGPVVTTFDVYSDFFSYAGGVYEYAHGTFAGGHAVLIVGYVDDASINGGGYFIVKNSWGTGWGEKGYFNIAYSQTGSPVGFGEYTIAYQQGATPPLAPSGLTATAAAGSNSVALKWSDNAANESGYKIERCAGAGCSSFGQIATVGSSTTSYTNTGLGWSTSYTYRVRAYNSGGDSATSNVASATTPAQPPVPVPPSGLVGTVSRTQISLSWTDNSADETGFRIERCIGATCTNFAQIATVAANTARYNNAGLRKTTTYRYRVASYNGSGISAYSNIVAAATTR